jgi:uncharacterized membrane protein
MNQRLKIALLLVLYLAVDIAYVSLSLKLYTRYQVAIASGTPKNTLKVVLCAALAYTTMAIGWLFVCLPLVDAMAKRIPNNRRLAGFVAGALYGFVLYGVFNFTVGAMFDGWTWRILAQDLAWGTISLGVITSLV